MKGPLGNPALPYIHINRFMSIYDLRRFEPSFETNNSHEPFGAADHNATAGAGEEVPLVSQVGFGWRCWYIFGWQCPF